MKYAIRQLKIPLGICIITASLFLENVGWFFSFVDVWELIFHLISFLWNDDVSWRRLIREQTGRHIMG
jgi:hypothetical protein